MGAGGEPLLRGREPLNDQKVGASGLVPVSSD